METRLVQARRARYVNRPNLNFGYIQVRSLQSLRFHLDFVDKNDAYKNVDTVEIDLHDHAKWDQPVHRVSNLLLGIPSIDTLIIKLPNLSKTKAIRLFRRVALPNLQNLAFTKMHHSVVSQFVARHAKLSSISVGCCAGGACDLSTLSGYQPLDIHEVIGPSPCICGLVSATTQAVQVVWDLNNISGDKDTALFSRAKAVQTNVRIFSTQFFPEDIVFTGRLSEAFPLLSSLKLVEAPLQTTHHVNYSCTLDHATWINGLKALVSLGTLEIHTTRSPIAQPGDKKLEAALIKTLAGSNQRHLTTIILGYSCNQVSYESTWKRQWGSRVWCQLFHSQAPKSF